MDASDLSMFFQTIAPAGMLLNGVAPGLGVAATAGLEGLGNIAATKAKNQATGLIPPEQDPAMATYLNQIDRQKRTFETGSAYAAQMRELKNQQSATQQGIVKTAGGNSGAAISGLSRAQQNTGDTYGKIVAQGTQRQDEYQQMYGNMLQDISNRRLGIQMMKYSQAEQDARQNQANTSQSLMNLMAVMKAPDFKKLFGGGTGVSNGATNQNTSMLPQTPQAQSNAGMQPIYNDQGYVVPQAGGVLPVNLPQNNTFGGNGFNNQIGI